MAGRKQTLGLNSSPRLALDPQNVYRRPSRQPAGRCGRWPAHGQFSRSVLCLILCSTPHVMTTQPIFRQVLCPIILSISAMSLRPTILTIFLPFNVCFHYFILFFPKIFYSCRSPEHPPQPTSAMAPFLSTKTGREPAPRIFILCRTLLY